jgi:hypothetical protein
MLESMMGFMMDRMSKEDKEDMMNKMMEKMTGDMSAADKQAMMSEMMPKMMEGMNMMDMMPKMMMGMMGGEGGMSMGGGCMSGGEGGAGMGGMMARMLPQCLAMAAKQTPAEGRPEAVIDLLATLVASGLETVEPDARADLLAGLKARLDTLGD